jgi:hypothetical protein
VILDNDELVTAVEHGKWVGGGLAEASFKFGDTGGSAIAESGGSGTEGYGWTHTGVSLELAGIFGKVYPEEELNAK